MHITTRALRWAARAVVAAAAIHGGVALAGRGDAGPGSRRKRKGPVRTGPLSWARAVHGERHALLDEVAV